MSHPRHALLVAPAEVRLIQELIVAVLRVVDLTARTGRSESTVCKAVRGLKRRRQPPPAHNQARDRRIVALVSQQRRSLGEVANEFGLTKTRVCQIVREALGLRAKPTP